MHSSEKEEKEQEQTPNEVSHKTELDQTEVKVLDQGSATSNT